MVLELDLRPKCAGEDARPQEGWTVVSHIAREVNVEEPYMEGFYSTQLRLFLRA